MSDHEKTESKIYPPGQEPEKIKKRLDTLFAKLDEAYPDKVIVGLQKDHKEWGKTVTQLYRLLGYQNGNAFLEAYGYTVKRGASGRPAGKHMDVINELKRRYADGPVCATVKELKEANPDLAPKFKNLNNQSEKFFGMKFAKYLIQEGILAGTIADPAKDAEIFEDLKKRCSTPSEGSLLELQQAFPEIDWNAINRHFKHSESEKTFKDFLISNGILSDTGDSTETKLSIVTEELKKRYPSEKRFRGSMVQLKDDNPDLPISSLNTWARNVYQLSAKEYLIQQGIMEKEKVKTEEEKLAEIKESLTEIMATLKERYSSGEMIAFTYKDLQKQNPDLSVSSMEYWVRLIYHKGVVTYLREQGILHEYTYEDILERDKREAERQEAEKKAFEEKLLAEMATPVSPLYYKPQVYTVKEVDVPKNEINKWVFRDDYKGHKGEIYLQDYKGNEKHLVIPVSLNGKRISCIDSFSFTKCRAEVVEIPGYYKIIPSVFEDNKHIKTVIIGEGVHTISGKAFEAAINLENVYVSQSVEQVCNGAFCDTKWLNQTKHAIAGRVYFRYKGNGAVVNIPHGVRSIASQVIQGCPNVRKVIIPDTVTTLDDKAFDDGQNGKIREFVLPDSLTHIGERAFGTDNPWINSFKNTFVIINRQLYQYNGKDTSVTIPEGVERIVGGVFAGDYFTESEIKNVVFPESVISIGKGAFSHCKKVSKIEFPKRLQILEDYCFCDCETLTAIILPDSLIEIGDSAFDNCEAVKTIRLGSNLSAIGYAAFNGCRNTSNIDLPKSLNSIAGKAFSNCRSLTSIAVPINVKKIENETFSYCVNLQSIELSPSLSYIGVKAFEGCYSLEEITIPQPVTEIKESTFENCTRLRHLRFNHKLELIDDKAFYNCSLLEEIKLAKCVGKEAFKDCKNLFAIEFHPEMTRIEDATFENCISLTEIILPDGIKSIGENAFRGCVNLKKVVLPPGLKSIGNNAFYGCTSLEDVIMPNSIEKLGTDVFTHTPYLKKSYGDFAIVGDVLTKYLGNAKKVTIPNNVSIIGERAFSESWQVESIIVPDTVKIIEANLLQPLTCSEEDDQHPQLKELIIGEGVTLIGKSAFAGCKELRRVVFGSSLKTIGESAFSGCSKLEQIDLSKTPVVDIGDYAFIDCYNVRSLVLSQGLQKIGMRAFYNVGTYHNLSSIHIPASVQSIGCSSFYGAKELIVYDTIESEPKYGYVRLGEALLNIPENTIICVENTNWNNNYHITVLSAETGKIKYRVFCDCKELYRHRAMMLGGWSKNADFVFDDYDEYFMKSIHPSGRTEMAFCRIQHPYMLSEKHRADYEAYLERCLFIERSARRTAKIIAAEDSVQRLSILHHFNAIDQHNIAWLKEVFRQEKASHCLNYLNKHFAEKGE